MQQKKNILPVNDQEAVLSYGGYTAKIDTTGALQLFDNKGKSLIDVAMRTTAIAQLSGAFPMFAQALQKEALERDNEAKAINAMAGQATAAFTAVANDNQAQPILELGTQQADTSYFVGYNAKNEALFLFLDNASDVSSKGLMTHDQAEKAFKKSKGFKGHKASQFQTEKDIDANQTDGGIRQFTAAEWGDIMNNLMGEGVAEPQKATMLALWDKVKEAVTKQGDNWVNTASPRGSGRAVFQDVPSGHQSLGYNRFFSYDAVLSGRSAPRP